jgi:hypothetical protein
MSELSKKVMFIDEFDDLESIWYKACCDCGGDDEVDMEMEFDKRTGYINLYFWKTVKLYEPYIYNESILDKIERYLRRVGTCIKILFTGYAEMNESFLLREEDHINDFIKALEEGKKKCIEWREKRKNENKI